MNAHNALHTLRPAAAKLVDSVIRIARDVMSLAVIMIGAASLGSSPAMGKTILKLPNEFERVCSAPKPADAAARAGLFWKEFDRLLYHSELAEVVQAESGEWPRTVLPAWGRYADATAQGRAAAREAWRKALQAPAAQRDLINLSSYQLTLLRCFFPSQGPAGFDGDAVTQAFEALALGRYAPANDPLRGRMDTIGGWIVWYAFADSAAEIALTSSDRLAWETLRRMTLYGLLLHAHHDTRACPGAQCQRFPQVVPAGLASTDMAEIKRFVGATDVAAAELDAYARLKPSNPDILAAVVVPQAARVKAAAAKLQSGKTLEELEAEVAELRDELGRTRVQVFETENAIETLKSRYGFVVMAFFDFDPKDPVQLKELATGRTAGLPTIMYNWECNPCYKVGNMHWLRGVDAGNLPSGWKWTYVATRHFATAYEAESWLKNSEEGRFIDQHAKVIMRTTVTDYTPY